MGPPPWALGLALNQALSRRVSAPAMVGPPGLVSQSASGGRLHAARSSNRTASAESRMNLLRWHLSRKPALSYPIKIPDTGAEVVDCPLLLLQGVPKGSELIQKSGRSSPVFCGRSISRPRMIATRTPLFKHSISLMISTVVPGRHRSRSATTFEIMVSAWVLTRFSEKALDQSGDDDHQTDGQQGFFNHTG